MDTKHNWPDILNPRRRSFLKTVGAGTAVATTSGLVEIGFGEQEAKAFAYEPYPRDDELTTVVTSCAHNCGSRHMLVAHKKGDVIVRLSTDDGRYQEGGFFGKDTEEEPQIRACLRRCRSRRQRCRNRWFWHRRHRHVGPWNAGGHHRLERPAPASTGSTVIATATVVTAIRAT